jgi:hypothetical protein
MNNNEPIHRRISWSFGPLASVYGGQMYIYHIERTIDPFFGHSIPIFTMSARLDLFVELADVLAASNHHG